jgi:hypothetical protein
MCSRQLLLFLISVLLSAFVNAQIRSEKLELSPQAAIKSLPVVDSPSVYHQKGIEIEKSFQNPALKKDSQLESREFIIERSPNIKIEYKPSIQPSNNKNN